jgi:hypothetical protein
VSKTGEEATTARGSLPVPDHAFRIVARLDLRSMSWDG